MSFPAAPAAAAPPQKKPGPGLWLSLGIMGAALVIGIPSLVMFVRPFVRTLASSSAVATPGTFTQHLNHGTYSVYERTFGNSNLTTLSPFEVTIEDPSGQPVVSTTSTSNELISHDSQSYVSAVTFSAAQSGTYRIRIAGAPGSVIVAKTYESTFHEAAPWLAPMALSGIAFLAGVTMLIVGLVRRGRSNRTLQPAYGWQMPTPAGWYADPQFPSRWRYWDGARWTEHVSGGP